MKLGIGERSCVFEVELGCKEWSWNVRVKRLNLFGWHKGVDLV